MFSQNKKYEVLIPWNKEMCASRSSLTRSLPQLKAFYGVSDGFNWDLIYSRSENHHVPKSVGSLTPRFCSTWTRWWTRSA